MLGELDVIKLVAESLDRAEIDYMLTGSLAMNYYSEPRMTRDIDIVVGLGDGDIDRIYAAFKEGFYIDKDMIKDAVSREGMFNIIHDESVIKIDFIIKKNTEYRELEFTRRKKIDIEGTQVWIASAEDMILSKMLWAKDSHSEMQLRDVCNMISYIQDLDKAYLEKWVDKLGLRQLYSEALHE